MENKKNWILMLLVFLIFVLIFMSIMLRSEYKARLNFKGIDENAEEDIIEIKTNEIRKNILSNKNERERIEYYIASFMKSIENKDYGEAYDMLYIEFKKNYFPNYSEFENYVKSNFPFMMAYEFENFERNDDTYIVWIKLFDVLSNSSQGKEMNFVIRENDLNNIDLSFSVN